MKTLLYADYDRIELSERDVPEIRPDEVLLKVAACGLCGSELEGVRHRSPRRKPPLVLGHEFCGVIEEVGSAVQGFRKGQRVVSNALVTCDECARCRCGRTHLCGSRQVFGMNRLGAFSEYVNAPARSLFAWPDHVPAEAAALTEPLANGVHVAELIRDQHPQTVMVIGAGPIGLMCQQTAQVMLGARTIVTDRVPERLAVARRLGAERTFVADKDDVLEGVAEITEGEGVDVVIDAAGYPPTKRLSIDATRLGGTAVWIGLGENPLTFDSFPITLGERRIQGSYATHAGDMQYALDLISDGKVDVTSWITQFPLEQGVEAFWRMMRAEGNDIKAVLRPSA